MAVIQCMMSAVGDRFLSKPILKLNPGNIERGMAKTFYHKEKRLTTYVLIDYQQHRNYYHFFSTLVHELTHFLAGEEYEGPDHGNGFVALGTSLMVTQQTELNLDFVDISKTDIIRCP